MSVDIGQLGGSLNSAALPIAATDVVPIEQGGISRNTYVPNIIGVGSGVHRIVQTVIVPFGGQASIVLTFPVGYTNARIEICGRGTAAAETAFLQLVFNNDVGGNYDIESFYATGATGVQSATLGQINMVVSYFNAATATANYPTQVDMRMCGLGAGFYQSVLSQFSFRLSSTAALGLIAGIWKSTASVTTATLSLSAGNFAQYTKATLSVQ